MDIDSLCSTEGRIYAHLQSAQERLVRNGAYEHWPLLQQICIFYVFERIVENGELLPILPYFLICQMLVERSSVINYHALHFMTLFASGWIKMVISSHVLCYMMLMMLYLYLRVAGCWYTFECCCVLARCCLAMCAIPEEVTREELTKSLGGRELIMEDLEFRHWRWRWSMGETQVVMTHERTLWSLCCSAQPASGGRLSDRVAEHHPTFQPIGTALATLARAGLPGWTGVMSRCMQLNQKKHFMK